MKINTNPYYMDILLLLLKSPPYPQVYHELVTELFLSSLLFGILALFTTTACEIIWFKINNLFINNS